MSPRPRCPIRAAISRPSTPRARAPPTRRPVCLYLEVTNRCNLLCETCPRTFEELEPPADMSWELFTRIVDQVPGLPRVVLHGVGEPMLVQDLPRMIRYLKERGIYVLFNTNGTLLRRKALRELIETGLDELRVSLDAADAETFAQVRGKDILRPHRPRRQRASPPMQREIGRHHAARLALADRPEGNGRPVAGFRAPRRAHGRHAKCICSAWCSTKPAAAWRAPKARLFEADPRRGTGRDRGRAGARRSARRHARCLRRHRTGPEPEARRRGRQPWSACRRPWSLMYFTAHGRALPCCIAPFSARGYETYTLGDATQQTPARNLERRRPIRISARALLERGAAEALPELRAAMEPVGRRHSRPLNEAAAIGARHRAKCRAASRRRDHRRRRRQPRRHAGSRARRRRARHRCRRAATAAPAPPAPRRRRRHAASSSSWTATAPTAAICSPGSSHPICAGTHDFVLASRTRGDREPGSMSWHQVLAGRARRLRHGRAVRRALQRHVRLPRHPPRRPAPPRHARNDLWLEHRDADEGRPRRPAHSRNAAALSLPRRRRLESRGLAAGHAARRHPHHRHLRPRRPRPRTGEPA